MSPRLQQFSVSVGLWALAAACDPNVVIGTKSRVAEGLGGLTATAGTANGAGGTGAAGAGASAGTDAVVSPSAGEAGAGGAPPAPPEWCATAPWLDKPVQFTSDIGNVIPAGSYVIKYEHGAQIHDPAIGYEVTGHYVGKSNIEAGHHIFSGDTPETSSTSLWLDDTGLVSGGTVAQVEAANHDHTWPLEHGGGELRITLYDDDYHDNSGPGSRFCITAATP